MNDTDPNLPLETKEEIIDYLNRELILRKIATYREWDTYNLDLITTPAYTIHIPQKLPSEPDNGITYSFGPSGYITQNRDKHYTILYSSWRNPDNYCHWTLSEIPLIHLTLTGPSPIVVIPDTLLYSNLPYQKRWLEILIRQYPQKKVIPLSRLPYRTKGIIPINHDTSSCISHFIGKAPYKEYHHSRATPYTLGVMDTLKYLFNKKVNTSIPYIYICRTTKLLQNETALRKFLAERGFSLIYLEEYTLDEQIELFENASIVIGFHGAGLTNIVFSNSSLKVLEIVDPDYVYPTYKDGLSIAGQKASKTYFHMICHMKNIEYEVICSNNFFLNLEELDDKLSQLF